MLKEVNNYLNRSSKVIIISALLDFIHFVVNYLLNKDIN